MSARVRRRRLTAASLTTGVLLVTAWACGGAGGHSSPTPASAPRTVGSAGATTASPGVTVVDRAAPVIGLSPAADSGRGRLAPGSDPNVLPGPLLIADKKNNRLIIVDRQGRIRWQFPRPGDLARGQTFRIPDDAFFTPDGRHIIATQEDDYVVTVIDIATHRIVWRYGVPGVPGSGPNHLYNPDDAMVLPDGAVVAGDIKNCRLVMTRLGLHHLTRSEGAPGSCYHDPPHAYGSPNGMFPMRDGNFVVTEINGDWVDLVTAGGRVLWSTHPPGVAYPSDTNRYGPHAFLTVDYSSPGQIVLFDRAGRTLWRFAPAGPNRLDKPSLALPLPNGDVIATDDANHRVIVVDPHTNRIVWQYGHTGVAGRSAGYLDNPDGLDLLPPYDYISRLG